MTHDNDTGFGDGFVLLVRSNQQSVEEAACVEGVAKKGPQRRLKPLPARNRVLENSPLSKSHDLGAAGLLTGWETSR